MSVEFIDLISFQMKASTTDFDACNSTSPKKTFRTIQDTDLRRYNFTLDTRQFMGAPQGFTLSEQAHLLEANEEESLGALLTYLRPPPPPPLPPLPPLPPISQLAQCVRPHQQLLVLGMVGALLLADRFNAVPVPWRLNVASRFGPFVSIVHTTMRPLVRKSNFLWGEVSPLLRALWNPMPDASFFASLASVSASFFATLASFSVSLASFPASFSASVAPAVASFAASFFASISSLAGSLAASSASVAASLASFADAHRCTPVPKRPPSLVPGVAQAPGIERCARGPPRRSAIDRRQGPR